MRRQRIDSERAAAIVRAAIRPTAGHPVVLEHDATFDGDTTLTIVQARSTVPDGSLPSNLWLYRVEVTLLTYGPTVTAALDGNRRVGDTLIDTTRVEGVRLSSTTCTGEPSSAGRQTPTSAATVVSTYTTYLRNEGVGNG